jgi:DNA-binding beta-propeller fold protein YncE
MLARRISAMIDRPLRTAATTLLRASLAVALFLPLAHPASAAQETAAPLSPGARLAQLHRTYVSPSATLHRLLARARIHDAAKKAKHFQFPYGLAADPAGNVFVTNYNANSLATISPAFKITENVISQGLNSPVSVAVGPNEALYVGNIGGGGYVERYAGSTPQQSITSYAPEPYSIAVDQFDDLYVVDAAGIAVDDENGNALYGPGYSGYGVVSLALGNGAAYAFTNGNYLAGSGSVFLRSDGLQEIVGPTGSTDPIAATCGDNDCWYSDPSSDTISINNGSSVNSVPVPYQPVGIAYDQVHNRLYVADPANNAVHVYNAQSLALERTLT